MMLTIGQLDPYPYPDIVQYRSNIVYSVAATNQCHRDFINNYGVENFKLWPGPAASCVCVCGTLLSCAHVYLFPQATNTESWLWPGDKANLCAHDHKSKTILISSCLTG